MEAHAQAAQVGSSAAPGLPVRDGAARALNSYQQNQVLTASREQLVVLTYDGIVRFLGRACRGLESGDYHEKHLGMARAEALIIELARALDHSAAPELAASLARIYGYWLDELMTADAADDSARLRAVVKLVGELREAWADAARGATGDA